MVLLRLNNMQVTIPVKAAKTYAYGADANINQAVGSYNVAGIESPDT